MDSRVLESVPFTQREVEETRESNDVDIGAVPRSFQITDELIEKYGFTVGRRRCLAMRISDPTLSQNVTRPNVDFGLRLKFKMTTKKDNAVNARARALMRFSKDLK